MAARLKVFSWSDGFHAFTVAASSKPKALQAWGMGQDIFKSGLAREVTEGPAYDAALKSPGEVIQMGETVDLGAIKKATRPSATSGAKAAQKKKLASLEAALADLDAAQADSLAALDAEIAGLQAQRGVLVIDQDKERRVVTTRLKNARKTL